MFGQFVVVFIFGVLFGFVLFSFVIDSSSPPLDGQVSKRPTTPKPTKK